MAKSEWSLTEGTDKNYMLGDGQGHKPKDWDVLSGRKPSSPPLPPPGLTEVDEAYQIGFEDGARSTTPTGFLAAARAEVAKASGDAGLLIGRELRNEIVKAVDDMLHVEPPPPRPHQPSRVGQAAKAVGKAAWNGTKIAAAWTVKEGLKAANRWWQNRHAKTATPASADSLLGEGNIVIDAEFVEVPRS